MLDSGMLWPYSKENFVERKRSDAKFDKSRGPSDVDSMRMTIRGEISFQLLMDCGASGTTG